MILLANSWTLDAMQLQAVSLSVIVATFSVLCSLPVAIVAAWTLSRHHFVGKSVLESILNLPLVVPPVVTGYLLLVTFGNRSVVGRFLNDWLGIQIIFDWKGAALAAAVISFPLMVRSIKQAFDSVDRRLEKTALTLGASRLDSFFTISLPLAKRGIFSGCILSFARSLGEFGATIMIAGNIAGETKTIPLYIFDQLQNPDGFQKALPVVIVSIFISCVALWFSNFFEKQNLPEDFHTETSKRGR